MAKLTAKQATFVQEYLVDLNATQAAIRAGYSEKTAQVIGAENLSKPYIAEAIAEAQNARSERTEITADLVLESIYRVGKKAEKDGQFSAALKASELLGKHLGLFVPQPESKETDRFMEIRYVDTDNLKEKLKRIAASVNEEEHKPPPPLKAVEPRRPQPRDAHEQHLEKSFFVA